MAIVRPEEAATRTWRRFDVKLCYLQLLRPYCVLLDFCLYDPLRQIPSCLHAFILTFIRSFICEFFHSFHPLTLSFFHSFRPTVPGPLMPYAWKLKAQDAPTILYAAQCYRGSCMVVRRDSHAPLSSHLRPSAKDARLKLKAAFPSKRLLFISQVKHACSAVKLPSCGPNQSFLPIILPLPLPSSPSFILLSFFPSFILSFVPSFAHSFFQPFLPSSFLSFLHSVFLSFVLSFIHSCLHCFIHYFILSFLHSFLSSVIPSVHLFFRGKASSHPFPAQTIPWGVLLPTVLSCPFWFLQTSSPALAGHYLICLRLGEIGVDS